MLGVLTLAFFAAPGTLSVGEGGAFPGIQSAIDAAMPGDVIAIRPGTYAGFELTKSLTISAYVPGSVNVVGATTISGISSFTLSDISFSNREGDPSTVLHITNVTGRGTIDKCRVVSSTPWVIDPFVAGNSLRIDLSSDLVISRTSVVGAPVALVIRLSSPVAVVDCELIGSDDTVAGGDGVRLLASDVHIAGGLARGGSPPLSAGNSPGGDAIRILAFGSNLTVSGTELDPGTGLVVGPGVESYCVNFDDDEASFQYGGTCSGIPPTMPEPRLIVRETLPPASDRAVSLYGPPGEMGVVLFSLNSAQIPIAGNNAFLWIDNVSGVVKQMFFTHQTYTSSQDRSLDIPVHDPSLDGVVVHVQAFFPLAPVVGSPNFGLATNPSNIVIRPTF